VTLEAQWADSSETRTTMDASDNVHWNSEDQINCNGATSTKTAVQYNVGTDEYTKALFTVDANSPYYAMYPSTIGGNKVNYNGDGAFTFTFPAEQPYNNNTSFSRDYNPSTAYSTGTRVYFYNSCGIVRATLKGNFKNVRKARFVSAGLAVAGGAKVAVSTDDSKGGAMTITDTYTKGTNDYVDVAFDKSMDLSTAVTVYWILPPADYGTPTIELLGEKDRLLGEITAKGTVPVKRSVITNLNQVTPFVAEAYPIWEDTKGLVSDIKYITTSGSDVTPSGYTDLSQVDFLGNKGIANCYVVPANSDNTKWCIPAEKIGGTWLAPNTYICFTVNKGLYGNALLGYSSADVSKSQTSSYSSDYAAKDWSWHIWVPSVAPKEETYNNLTELDMSLGAIDKSSIRAALYQWGRKDPFMNLGTIYANVDGQQVQENQSFDSKGVLNGSEYMRIARDANTGTDTYAMNRPDEYIYVEGAKWGDGSNWLTSTDKTRWDVSGSSKTVNDPCPVGYQVTYTKDIWGNKLTSEGATNGVMLFGSTFFPYSQHLNSSTGLNAECKCGHVWTTVFDGNRLYYMQNEKKGTSDYQKGDMASGFSVRPMKSK
jgi:hypothetical protein